MVRDSRVDSGFGDFPKKLYSAKYTFSKRKETMLFTGLVVSWMILNFMWKTKQIQARVVFFGAVLLMIVGISMS
jgi:hypothetical protein